jgi:EmrB/QacA subfamily drug resistance transporter
VPLCVLVAVLCELWEVLEESLPPHPASTSATAAAANRLRVATNSVRRIDRTLPTGDRAIAANEDENVSIEAPASPPANEPRPPGRGLGSGSGWLLGVCCVAQFMVILDLSIVNVALPSIQSSLGFSSPDLQWVVNAYAITFAGFLLLGGRVADRFGQRRMFVVALVLFGLASLVGGAAPDGSVLIGARAGQGLAGALMAASSLAIITSSFEPGPKLHRAIGTWAAMNGLGGAAGVLLGGIITQELSWRWILLINPPIAVVTALVAHAVVRDRRRVRDGASFDIAGALTLTLGQMVLVYGVVEAGLAGWHAARALGPMIAGVALLATFVVIEIRVAAAPLIPFKELTKPLRTANNIVLLFSAALFPMWFVSSLYIQQVLGLSPLHTGLIFLPMTLMIMLVASRAGRLVGRFGVRSVLGSGLIMLTAGMLLLARIGASGSAVVYVMVPGLLTAAGIAMSIVPSTIAATQGAKEGQGGLASGLVNTSRQVGGGLGLAVLITLATQRSSHLIGSGVEVPQALTDGFRLAYLIGGGLAGAAALMTFTLMPTPAAGREPSGRRLTVAIAVLVAAFVAIDVAFANSRGAPIGAYTLDGAESFVTAPSLHPPRLRTDQATLASQLAPGYIFTANFYNLSYPPIVGQSGPLILDDRLQPVWFKPVPLNLVAGNLSLQTYQGKPALAWWQGYVTNTGATISGEDVVVNQHYQTVATLKGTDGWKITLHELVIKGDDAWVTANKDISMNLSKYGGAYNGALDDSAVQEYNLKTGKLLFSWDARTHIPPGDSQATLPTNGFPWDAYHVNSLQLIGTDTFLVSMRDTWAAYLINIHTGAIEWTLGGKHSSFKAGRGAAFQWQHDVALHPDSTVTMFDDHCCQLTGGGTYVTATAPSRGLVLKLDLTTHTATRLTDYGTDFGLNSDYMGNTQLLPNGNAVIGWGSSPYLTEYSPSHTPLLDGIFPGANLSYRATVEQWVGLPDSPPAGAARRTAGRTTVYASWNGATRAVAWRVLAGPSASRLSVVADAAKSGFETAIALPRSYASYEVEALDANHRVIGTSARFVPRS